MSLNIVKKGKGEPVVFFHGWGFDHQIWLSLVPELVDHYQLYLVDLPGYGHSSRMGWGDFKTHLLAQLPEHFAVAGWSLGGLFASRLTIEAPSRVTHLINIASSPRFIREKDWPGVDKGVFDAFCANLVASPIHTIEQFVGLQLNGKSWQAQNFPLAQSTSLEEGLEILANWDLREALFSVERPTCFMFGRLDAITTRRTMAVMQQKYPQFSYIMFSKAAHIPFLAEKEAFISSLMRFLQ